MNEHETFFLQQSVKHALTLSHRDCLHYLQGLLFAVGDYEPAHDLRSLVIRLRETDVQLELIANGQLKLGL